jgi:hypothetical protein
MIIKFYIGYLFIGKTKWLGGVKLEVVFYDRDYYRLKKKMRMLRRKIERKTESPGAGNIRTKPEK